MIHQNIEETPYFTLRGVKDFSKENYDFPAYLLNELPIDKNVRICDLGCGFGRLMIGLQKIGYTQVFGVDQDIKAVEWCHQNKLTVSEASIVNFVKQAPSERFDVVIMSHVLEHLPKENIIETLKKIKNNLLVEGGKLYIIVPNAQSATGCYWAYEDFTHSTLFTAGSLSYVLKAAGFEKLELIDPYCLAGLSSFRVVMRKILLKIYQTRLSFWNKVTASSFHVPSPNIYSFEIKIRAS